MGFEIISLNGLNVPPTYINLNLSPFRSNPHPETLTWEEKILTTEWSDTSAMSSKESTRKT